MAVTRAGSGAKVPEFEQQCPQTLVSLSEQIPLQGQLRALSQQPLGHFSLHTITIQCCVGKTPAPAGSPGGRYWIDSSTSESQVVP